MSGLSVVICAHNPHRGRFERVTESLRSQTLPAARWELVVVDNRSDEAIQDRFDFRWHPKVRHVRENRLGLVHARVAGTRASSGAWCVTVDDDTPLAPDYLEQVEKITTRHPDLGVFGGRSDGEFETPPPSWLKEFPGVLAINSHGEEEFVIRHEAVGPPTEFLGYCPILIAYNRRAYLQSYVPHYTSRSESQLLGRRGTDLASGEDNDIAFVLYAAGYAIGYFPQLRFLHLIPAYRLTAGYIARLLEASNRTWVVTLGLHGVSPWGPIAPWTLGLRKLRAAVRTRAWRGGVARLRWKAACGNLAGRADLWTMRTPPRIEDRPVASRETVAS